MEHAGSRDFVEERRHGDPFAQLFPGGETHRRERPVHQGPEVGETAAEDGPGAATDADRAPLERMKGEERGVELVTQFMSGLPETLYFLARSSLGGESRVLGDGFGNRGIEAVVQRVEFLDADRG